MTETRPCRRCSECANSAHHWLDCCEVIDEGLETGELIFDRVCKHCGLLGTACEECDGWGLVGTPAYVAGGEIVGQDGEECAACKGNGVIESCLYSSEDEE